MIASASHCCFFLLLIFAFQINAYLHSPNGEMEAEIDEVSGEEYVEVLEIGSAMITKLRMLLGLQPLSSASKTRIAHQLCPAPSPAPSPLETGARSPVSLPLLHKHQALPKAPPPHQGHLPLVHGTENQKAARRKSLQMIVAISISVAATLAFATSMAVLVLAHRRRRHKRNTLPCNSSNKVSFDPEPAGMFYLDSLAPFLDTISICKQSSELKSVASAESIQSSPSQNGELSRGQSNLDMENDINEFPCHVKSPSSDGNESFHSVCCSASVCSSPANSHLSPPISSSNSAEFSNQNGTILHIPSSHQSASKEADESLNPKSKLLSEPTDQMVSESSSNLMPPAAEVMSEPIPLPVPPQIMTKPLPPQLPQVNKHKPLESPWPQVMNKTKQLPQQPLQVMDKPKLPPPLAAATAAAVPPPPPPPFLLQQKPKLGKDGNPLPKLKPLHWDKVKAAADHSMVWDKIRSSSFDRLDEKTIEMLFGYSKHLSANNEEPKGKSSSASKQVLEHKRLQNFTILLKAINATFAFSKLETMLYRETFEDEVIHHGDVSKEEANPLRIFVIVSDFLGMLNRVCKELRSSKNQPGGS